MLGLLLPPGHRAYVRWPGQPSRPRAVGTPLPRIQKDRWTLSRGSPGLWVVVARAPRLPGLSGELRVHTTHSQMWVQWA